MKRVRAILVVALGLLLAQPCLVFSKSTALGTITGMVRDDRGEPIIGALVKLLDRAVVDETVRSVLTDAEGKFSARNLLPGMYRVRAEADGFMSAAQPVRVKADNVLELNLRLRRVGTLVGQRADRDAYRWIVRGLPRPILRLEEGGGSLGEVIGRNNQTLSQSVPVHGMLQIVAGAPLGARGSLPAFGGLNLALTGQATPNVELIFVSQVSSLTGHPNRLQLIASTYAGDGHHLTANIGYASLRGIDEFSQLHHISQISLGLVDSWQLFGPVVIIYGVDLSRYSGRGTEWIASPRLGVTVAADSQTRFSADYIPVTSLDREKQGQFQYEGGQVNFSDPEDLAVVGDAAEPEKSRRLQLAVQRKLDEDSVVEGAVYYDQISGRGVGLLSLPIDAVGHLNATWQSIVQQGQLRGARVVYRRDMNSFLTGLIGYAVGQGQRLARGALTNPNDLLESSAFHLVSVQLNAHFARTGTQVSTTYRLGSDGELFAIDPFYGSLDVFNPNLNIVLTQDIPDFGILPGSWQASFDARNVFDQQDTVSADGQTLVLGNALRSIRGSLSVRF